MFERIYRYDKPVKEVFVDILNYTNKTDFKAEELSISEPVPLNHAYTEVAIRSKTDGYRSEVRVRYERQDLGVVFKPLPLVIWCIDREPQSLLNALKEQYQLAFTLDDVEFKDLPVSLAAALCQTNMEGFSQGDDTRELPSNETLWQGNFTMTARPGNLVWVGETPVLVRQQVRFMNRNVKTTLAMKNYFGDTLAGKVPVELVIDRALDATEHSRQIKKLKANTVLLQSSPFLRIAEALTKDKWVADTKYLPFNLYGAKVLYNGFNSGQYFTGYKQFSHVIALELSDRYCSNLTGIWLIHYKDRDAFTYSSSRIDRGPMVE